jgi:hypothetical protein
MVLSAGCGRNRDRLHAGFLSAQGFSQKILKNGAALTLVVVGK